MTKTMRLLATIASALLIGACSISPTTAPTSPPPSLAQWQSHQTRVSALSDWQIIGKVGFRTPDQASSASLNWQQKGSRFEIHLTGPFGQGGVELSGTKEQVQLNIAGRGEFLTDEPEKLLFEQIGWDIPVTTLLDWIRGIPSPNRPATFELDDRGRLATLNQAQWQLRYHSYQRVESLWLPKKIQLQRDQILLTLVIKRWAHSADTAG